MLILPPHSKIFCNPTSEFFYRLHPQRCFATQPQNALATSPKLFLPSTPPPMLCYYHPHFFAPPQKFLGTSTQKLFATPTHPKKIATFTITNNQYLCMVTFLNIHQKVPKNPLQVCIPVGCVPSAC